MILFLKTHVKGYTKKDGTYVAPHEDKRPRANTKTVAGTEDVLRRHIAEMGLEIYDNKRSSLSSSRYIEVFHGNEAEGYKTYKLRISDHKLPAVHKLHNGGADFEVSPDGMEHEGTHGNWHQALAWLSDKTGVPMKGHALRVHKKWKEERDAARQAQERAREDAKRKYSEKVSSQSAVVDRFEEWVSSLPATAEIKVSNNGNVSATVDGKLHSAFGAKPGGFSKLIKTVEDAKKFIRDWRLERDDGGLGDTITVDGKQRPTRNSAGQPIHPTEEGIRNFWRWFSGSRVVDEQGRPLVVYHGTNSDLSAFASDRANYFTADPGAASVYAEGFGAPREGANVSPVYLSIQRPKWMPLTDSAKLTAADLAAIKEEGFDGVFGWVLDIRMGGPTPIAREVGTGQRGMDKIVTEAIPLSPEQIKSAIGNRGTFDPSESSITKSHPAIQGASRAAAPADLNDGDARRNPGEPSREQAEAGRYNKPRVEWRGLTIAVENPAGSVRRGTNRDGQPWEIRMRYDYGEIVGSMGVDGDPVDVFLGPNLDAPMVYVVHQRKVNRWDQYDEDKCMVGFDSEEDAKAAFLSCYTDPRFLGPVTAMPVDEFVAKVRATRAKAAMIKAQQPIILFLKARDRHDTATGDLFGTHVESRTRKDGVVQMYHVSSPQPAIAVPALESAPGDKPVLFINHLQSKQSIGRDSKMSKDSPVETKQEDAVEEPAMPANAKLVTRDFVVKKVGRKWLTVTAPGKGYEMHLQLSPSTEHYKPGDAIKGIKVGEVREENRYGVKITYYVPNQRDLQRLEEAQAQEQDAKRKGEVERWLGYVEDKAKEGWLYENGLKKLAELGANADPAVKDRIEAARKQVASIKAARQQQYAQERREREAKLAETVSRRMLYPLWHMPPLNKPVRLGKEVVVFTGTGKPFRIDDSHPSMFGSHLLGHEGEKGAYAYYRPATPEEVAALEQREAEAKAAPPAERERHWAYSREAVDRALRGEE